MLALFQLPAWLILETSYEVWYQATVYEYDNVFPDWIGRTYYFHERGNTIDDLQEIHINHYEDFILIAALTIWRKLLHERRQVYMFNERMHGPLIVWTLFSQ